MERSEWCLQQIGHLLEDARLKHELVVFLLAAQEHFNHADEGGFYVTPRKGTISPWSSKATDIFHNCALEAVARVERGVHFRLSTADGLVVGIKDLGLGLLALHDRMTEAVYDDVSDFFSHFEPAPLRTVLSWRLVEADDSWLVPCLYTSRIDRQAMRHAHL